MVNNSTNRKEESIRDGVYRLSGSQQLHWGRGVFLFPWAPGPGGDVALTSNMVLCSWCLLWREWKHALIGDLLETLSRHLISKRWIS